MEVTARRTVLVAYAEALAAPEVVWSLAEAGFEVHAVTADATQVPLRRCASVRLHTASSPSENRDAALADLQRIIAKVAPHAVMPLNDAAVWLFDRLDLPESTVNVGPAGEQTDLALDKRKQVGAALWAGLTVPASGFFDSVEGALRNWTDFPVMVRPFRAIEHAGAGLGGRPGSACANRTELARALEPYADDAAFFLQPFKSGHGEGLFGIARDGEVLAWSSHQRVRMMSPHGSGSSACMPRPVDEALIGPAEDLVRNARWNGIFMIELLRQENGEVWFIELNGRAWGSMALARRMGYEFPAWAVSNALEEGFQPTLPERREPVVARHLGRELVHLLIVLRGPKSASLPPWPSKLRTLRDVLRVSRHDRWYNLRRGSFRLFLDDTITTVRGAVTGARRR